MTALRFDKLPIHPVQANYWPMTDALIHVAQREILAKWDGGFESWKSVCGMLDTMKGGSGLFVIEDAAEQLGEDYKWIELHTHKLLLQYLMFYVGEVDGKHSFTFAWPSLIPALMAEMCNHAPGDPVTQEMWLVALEAIKNPDVFDTSELVYACGNYIPAIDMETGRIDTSCGWMNSDYRDTEKLAAGRLQAMEKDIIQVERLHEVGSDPTVTFNWPLLLAASMGGRHSFLREADNDQD